MQSHLTRNALDGPKILTCSEHKFREFFGPNQKSLSLKMAEKYMVSLVNPCLRCHMTINGLINPKNLIFFIRNLYPTKV